MPIAHCVSTSQGIVLAADHGFLDLVRRPEHEVIGTSYRDLTHPDDLEKSARMLTLLVDRAPPVQLNKRYLRPDGSAVRAALFVTFFTDPDRLVSTLFWNEKGRELGPERLWEAALRLQHLHSVRRAAFGNDLTTDPLGVLMIAIYLAEAEGRVVGTEQLAAEADMPGPTTLRWICALQQRGILEANSDDKADVHFTRAGILDMERMLEAVFHLPRSLSDLA